MKGDGAFRVVRGLIDPLRVLFGTFFWFGCEIIMQLALRLKPNFRFLFCQF
jgi:hypothetical protein